MKMGRLVLGVLIGLSLIFCLSGLGYAGITFESQIPVRTIDVDGDPADWDGIEPFITDDQGDSTCEIGTDIKAVYLAKDDEFLYWRMDTWSGIYSPGVPGQEKSTQVVFYDTHVPSGDLPKYVVTGVVVIDSNEGGVAVNYNDPDWNWVTVYEGPAYGKVDQISEGKIPLSLLQDYEINSFGSHYHSGYDNITCDGSDRTFNPPQITLGGYVQHRIYEDSGELNRLLIEFYDENWKNVTQDNISTVELLDPNGNPLMVQDLRFDLTKLSYPRYDGETGQWIYPFQPDGNLFFENPGHFAEIQEISQKGNYHLTVTLTDGTIYETDFPFNGPVDLPVISSSSFKYQFDKDGNLIWTWDVPYNLDPEWETSGTARINIYRSGSLTAVLYTKVSTHLGKLFVPKEILEKVMDQGDTFALQFQLRINDNSTRTYSKEVKLKLK